LNFATYALADDLVRFVFILGAGALPAAARPERRRSQGLIGEMAWEITDSSGRAAMKYDAGVVHVPDTDGTGEEDAWRQVRERIRTSAFPRLLMQDASGGPLRAVPRFGPGIDGLVEPLALEH
jgi:hypothetical protein